MPRTTQPKISIVMSVFNNEADVGEAIESMLNQTFTDFEFIIINDASSDNSVRIIEAYSQKDDRIKLVHNFKNLKLAASLNRGIDLAQGQFIARMDADDVAMPERLQVQYDYMQVNETVAVCGTWVELYENADIVWKTNINKEAANCAAFFESCFHHPTVMIRKSVLDEFGVYNEEVTFAQDCYLWSHLAFDHQQELNNIPQVLLRYRSHPEKERDQYRLDQYDKATELRKRNLARLNLTPSNLDYQWHDVLCCAKTLHNKDDFKHLLKWVNRLEEANKSIHLLSSPSFAKEINTKLLGVCLASAEKTLSGIMVYWRRSQGDEKLKNCYRCLRMLFIYLKTRINNVSKEV